MGTSLDTTSFKQFRNEETSSYLQILRQKTTHKLLNDQKLKGSIGASPEGYHHVALTLEGGMDRLLGQVPGGQYRPGTHVLLHH
jgi:hypothetical protein